jgi:hypothetical protein
MSTELDTPPTPEFHSPQLQSIRLDLDLPDAELLDNHELTAFLRQCNLSVQDFLDLLAERLTDKKDREDYTIRMGDIDEKVEILIGNLRDKRAEIVHSRRNTAQTQPSAAEMQLDQQHDGNPSFKLLVGLTGEIDVQELRAEPMGSVYGVAKAVGEPINLTPGTIILIPQRAGWHVLRGSDQVYYLYLSIPPHNRVGDPHVY